MRHRQRKVRAPQSRVLGNAQAPRGDEQGHRDESARLQSRGETRQPPPGATSNRRTTTRLAESAGRWLEPWGNSRPRGMTVHDRTRLIGQLHFFFAPAQTGANFSSRAARFTQAVIAATISGSSPSARRHAEIRCSRDAALSAATISGSWRFRCFPCARNKRHDGHDSSDLRPRAPWPRPRATAS